MEVNHTQLLFNKYMATDLSSKKSQDISVILRLMDLKHRLHSGLHVVWNRTENNKKTLQSWKQMPKSYTVSSGCIMCVAYLTV